ncbi:MAG: DUF4159 domain-containing protein [Candidatus Kapabacteria bacterium]|nr:DUF4159 domain-containing protein [Candidatus Kapabacteria bacterium]
MSFICIGTIAAAQTAPASGSAVKVARVKYSGGGDWYNDPSAEINLLKYVRAHTSIAVEPVYEYVDLGTDNLFLYPVLFMTGHGTVSFTDAELRNLRAYLTNGGFLYIDDDYGMDESVRRELKRVFPDQQLRELPFSHPLYHAHFDFPKGLPKIHEHDNKSPEGLALFHDGKVCVFYTYETNPSDGWADPEVHNDPPERRETALKIGTNIIVYALSR